MEKKLTYVCILMISTLLVLNLLSKDTEISMTERRYLDLFPTVRLEDVISGQWMADFEDYAMDQFVWRDDFRRLKSYMELYVFGKNDVNGIYVYEDYLIKRVEAYKPEYTDYFVTYINDLAMQFSEDAHIYYTIIPDKNYFVADETYQVIDYDTLFDTVNQGLDTLSYIDIADLLSLEDYYQTDTHWRQEALKPIVEVIVRDMALDLSESQYEPQVYADFTGVYGKQSMLQLGYESLVYLDSPLMNQVVVTYLKDTWQEGLVYEVASLDGMDAYDVFLGGASPLITIENPHAQRQKSLVVFRDSFASSLMPLLIDCYDHITIVDTRYIPASRLSDYMSFEDQDVLFIYNTKVINQSLMLR